MKILLLIVSLTFYLCACSSTPSRSVQAKDIPEFTFHTSLERLKELSLQHANKLFMQELKDHKLDPDEITLRDYGFRFEEKTHPPVTLSVERPWLTEKRFGRKKDGPTFNQGPADIIVDTPNRFLIVYRTTAYVGEKLKEGESKLTVLKTKPFESVIEELYPKGTHLEGPLFFDSFVLDLDKSLKESTRDRFSEWEILRNAEPQNAQEWAPLFGIES